MTSGAKPKAHSATHEARHPNEHECSVTGTRFQIRIREDSNGFIVDDRRYSHYLVAAWISDVVHSRRFHPHPAGVGDHRDLDPCDPGAPTSLSTRVPFDGST
jgi:hypothetical protein